MRFARIFLEKFCRDKAGGKRDWHITDFLRPLLEGRGMLTMKVALVISVKTTVRLGITGLGSKLYGDTKNSIPSINNI